MENMAMSEESGYWVDKETGQYVAVVQLPEELDLSAIVVAVQRTDSENSIAVLTCNADANFIPTH